MNRLLTVLLLFVGCFLFAQEKGATPVAEAVPFGSAQGTTRAVVVGISDYQNADIPDLRFAHKDAAAFAKYLQSPGGGNVSNDNIRLLTNTDATMAAVASELDWLVEESQEGDKAIIYFSGHGDVEAKTARQPGFLLTYDSPPKIYIAGAYPLFYLQLIIETLSSDKNVQTLVITDACRAGKLAGSEIGGTQATAANLAKQYANEIKILSCQPDEYSLEGEQWGGGRGAFSYHLIEGMIGLADKNENGNVNLLELENYLETIVPEETDPQSQIPMTIGSKGTKVAFVDAGILAKLKDLKSKQLPTLAAIESKGMEETVLAQADSSVQKMYEEFIAALENENLLDSENGKPSADDLYRKLMAEESLESLHRFMTRKLATALQDDAQQAINAYLLANPAELEKRWKGDSTYAQYPRYLRRAAELLGQSHYMHKYLIAKQLYFEGLNLRMEANNSKDKKFYLLSALKKQEEALKLEDRAAYFYNEIGVINTLLKFDTRAFEYYDKAIELAPEWALPYANYAVGLYYNGDIEKAVEYGEKAGTLASEFPQIYSFLAWINANNYSWEDKRRWERTGTELQDKYSYELNNTGNMAQRRKRFAKSIELLKKAEALDSTNTSVLLNLGWLLEQISKGKSAIRYYKKVTELDSLNAWAYVCLGRVQGYTEESEKSFLKALKIDSTYGQVYGYLGNCYSKSGKPDQAIQAYKKELVLNPNWTNYHNLGFQNKLKNLPGKPEYYHLKGLIYSGNYPHPAQLKATGDYYKDFLKRYDTAADMYEMALEIKPDYVDVLKSLAEVYIKTEQEEKTQPIIDQFEKLAVENSYLYFDLADIYLQKGEKEKALKIMQDQIANHPEDPDILFDAAWRYQYDFGAYKAAEELFLQCQELGRSDIDIFAGLGYTYMRDGQHQKSLDYFQKMLELDSTNGFNIYHLACYYSILDQPELAFKWLEKSLQNGMTEIWQMEIDKDFAKLRKNPEYDRLMRKYFPQVYTNGGQFNPTYTEKYYLENCVLLARIYDNKGFWEKAKSMYEKAVSLKTDTMTNTEKLALAEAYLRLDDWAAAQAVCPEKVESDIPNDYYEYGKLFYKLNRFEIAEAHFRKYMELSNFSRRALSIGVFYYQNDEPELTEKYLLQSFEFLPDHSSPYFGFGMFYNSLGDLKTALQKVEEGIRRFPNDFDMKILKAFLVAYSGTTDEAKRAFDELDSFYPGTGKIFDCLQLMEQGKFEAAAATREEINDQFFGSFLRPIMNFAYLRMLSAWGKYDEAMDIIEENISGFLAYRFLQNEPALAPLRERERFKAYMRKHYPGKMH